MKITKIPAAGDTRMKPKAAPISIAEKGAKLELKTPIMKKRVKKIAKGGVGDCGCGGGKMKYQAGGPIPPSPLKPASPGIPSPGNIQQQSLDSLRVNKLQLPNTADTTPSAPTYNAKPPTAISAASFSKGNIPGTIPTVAGSLAKMMRKNAWKARSQQAQSKYTQQLGAFAKPKSTL